MNKYWILGFIIICSCGHPKYDTTIDIYKIVNSVLADQKKIENKIIITGDDTIRLNEFVFDCNPVGLFRLDTISGKIFIWLNNSRYPEDTLGRYFDKNDIIFIKRQLAEKPLSKWDTSLVEIKSISRTSMFKNDSVLPNPIIWAKLKIKEKDYFTISIPIFNQKGNKVIIGSGIFLEKYYLQSLIVLAKDDLDNWNIISKRTSIHKIVKKLTTENTTQIISIYKGVYE